ncbi:MAG: PHB depolymerase family esterase [Xanthobacteraceae bacterium]
MTDFSAAMAKIHAFRQRFETLLTSARGKTPGAFEYVGNARNVLKPIPDFGSNPGNLRMLVYTPENLPAGAPVVVALHGCSQNANEYDHGAGWSSLADRLGFLVVYPEQQLANNPKNCFSWFLPGDTARGDGEALSIHQMVEHAIGQFGADREKVFVTGLSAGGAMAVVMLATYPETFAGGATIAGLPYQSAKNVNEAFEAMFTDRHPSPRTLGDRVRAASKHHGPWPKISIWHGNADPIVKPSNAEQIAQQWTDVHSLSGTPSYEELIGAHTHKVWNDPDGDRLIEAFSVHGMAHGVPLDLNRDEESCGAVGPFFLDAGISSTHHIANFWGLADGSVTSCSPMIYSGSGHIAALPGATEREKPSTRNTDASIHMDARQNASYAVSDVIADAFKAAGLDFTGYPSGLPKPRFSPGPIIEAALKAAGLRRP